MANLCKEAALGPIRRLDFSDIESISAEQVALFKMIASIENDLSD